MNQAIITLKDKYQRTSKTEEKYYLLTYQLERTLTERYFELTKKEPTLKSNRKPLFLFNGKKKWARFLKNGEVYWVEYNVSKDFLHVKDWKILGDKLSIERSWRIIRKVKEHDNNQR